MMKKILVIGGAGYVGSVLVPKLLAREYGVRVLDTFWFGKDIFKECSHREMLECIEADIRYCDFEEVIADIDVIIHLACISNDPSFELNPELGRAINYDAFLRILRSARFSGVKRFVYASTSSVYGVKKEENVTEDLFLEPLTDYSKFKAFCEMELRLIPISELPWVIIRPATVCGYAPRLRLDLSVNILTIQALTTGKITVFGGSQRRPNIHIDDMTDLYVFLTESEDGSRFVGETFNAGGDNFSIMQLAEIVKSVVFSETGRSVQIEVQPSNDFRSYHISSQKIKLALNWSCQKTVIDGVRSLISAYREGKIPNPDDSKYYNIRVMQNLNLT